jgi:hypothetical protein
MRRYIITCELYKAKRAAPVADSIRRLAAEWHHPLNAVWIVKTPLSASEIRSALQPHLDFQDRLYICEAGSEAAEFNALAASGGKITQIGEARSRNRMLASIFGRDGNSSRHLKAATARNLKSTEGQAFGSFPDGTDSRQYYCAPRKL